MINDIVLYKQVPYVDDNKLVLNALAPYESCDLAGPLIAMESINKPVYLHDTDKRTRTKFVALIHENGTRHYIKMSDLKKHPASYANSIIYRRLCEVDVTDHIISNPDEASLTALIGPIDFKSANAVNDKPFTEDEIDIFKEIGMMLLGVMQFRRNGFSGYDCDWIELELRPIRVKEYEKHKREYDDFYYYQSKRALMYYILNACSDVTASDLAKFIVDHRS